MSKLFIVGTLFLSGCVAGVSAATAQTYACVAATDPESIDLRDYVVRLTGGDPALLQTRQTYQLPTASGSQIQIVKTKSTCQQAARAYHNVVRGSSAPAISRNVVVVKVGSTRYVVLDPAEREGEYTVTVVFDAAFAPLSSFQS